MNDYNAPLPQCEGSKLAPFHRRYPAITFRRLLSGEDSEGHGHVFDVVIDSTPYALKIVSAPPLDDCPF